MVEAIMTNESILVVEDDDLLRKLLQDQIAKAGYQVRTTSRVPGALQEVGNQMPDLVVLDLTLEVDDPFAQLNDGFGFLGMLRHRHPTANPAVIIFTENHSPEVVTRAKKIGVHSVINKKAGIGELVSAIQAALEDSKKPIAS